jgi:hypothetical protein
VDLLPVLYSCLLSDLDNHLVGGLAGFELDQELGVCREPVGCSAKQFAAAALLRSIPKKYQGNINQVEADKAAFCVFNEMNNRCSSWQPQTDCLGPFDEIVIGEIEKAVWEFFNPEGFPLIDLASIEHGVDFGPGTAPGARDSSYLDKIGHSNLTASSQIVIDLFDQWVKSSSLRVDTELCRTLLVGRPEVIDAVKITPVPKTSKISRLVKPEPLLNMFFQKGVQRILEGRLLSYFGIDLASQPEVNSSLAKLGSIHGCFSTLDLSSASDCLSMNLCEKLIPRSSLLWMKLLRSDKAIADGEIVKLHMMATMGNAFCFPLETAIFACIVKGVYAALGLPFHKRGTSYVYSTDEVTGEVTTVNSVWKQPNWAVFGDDIIVTDDAEDTVVRMLNYYGFILNKDKSYGHLDGCFRESCGADYYFGSNVRGVYVKTLNTEQDWFILINNLTDWSAKVGILLPLTLEFCKDQVNRVEVPPWENPDSGIRMPLDCVQTRAVFRQARPFKNGADYQGSYLYKRWVPRDMSDDVSSEVRAEKNQYWNSSAIFQAAVKGSLRGGRVSCTFWDTPYYKRIGVAPCWDHISPSDNRFGYTQSWYVTARAYFWEQ